MFRTRQVLIGLGCLITVVFITLVSHRRNGIYPVFNVLQKWPSCQPASEHAHIVYIKVHKTGSTTMLNIMARFALHRKLNALVNRNCGPLNENAAQIPAKSVLPLPPNTFVYDVLFSHVIFDRQMLGQYFPKDTVYIASLRNPFDQFVSAFKYYSTKFQLSETMLSAKDNPSNPIEQFLMNPMKYPLTDPRYGYLDNRMSIDLGVNTTDFQSFKKNETAISEFIRHVNDSFTLVMITEYFDESLILLKRALGWSFKDILHIKQNSFASLKKMYGKWLKIKRYSKKVHRLHRQWAPVDYALYDFFVKEFKRKVSLQSCNFQGEVQSFKKILNDVKRFCLKSYGSKNVLAVDETQWSKSFNVTMVDCKLIKKDEWSIMKEIMSSQRDRLLRLTQNKNNTITIRCIK